MLADGSGDGQVADPGGLPRVERVGVAKGGLAAIAATGPATTKGTSRSGIFLIFEGTSEDSADDLIIERVVIGLDLR